MLLYKKQPKVQEKKNSDYNTEMWLPLRLAEGVSTIHSLWIGLCYFSNLLLLWTRLLYSGKMDPLRSHRKHLLRAVPQQPLHSPQILF